MCVHCIIIIVCTIDNIGVAVNSDTVQVLVTALPDVNRKAIRVRLRQVIEELIVFEKTKVSHKPVAHVGGYNCSSSGVGIWGRLRHR